MHHPESSGDSTGTRKMAHPAMFPRKGSNTGIGSSSGLTTTTTSTNVSNTFIPVEDYQPPLLIQTPPPAGSSSPGPQHPQSLNLISQSQLQTQPLLSAGAQIKKKSGFQITSVTPAQISVSTNNSIAEDTESYDDLDESHTEDLSSSEILDVSLSRATDMGGPERSSSEETLNNFHEAETPGAVSPNQPHFSNQPPHHHPLPQVLQHGTMVNGTKHHPAQAVHSGVAFPPVAVSGGMLPGVPEEGAISAAVSSASGGLSSIAQKLPSNMGAIPETATLGTTGIVAQPLTSITQGTLTGMLSSAAGVPISGVNSLTSNVSNANRLSSTSMPVLGGNSLNSSSSSSAATGCSSQNVNMLLKQSGTASTSIALSAAGGMGPAGSVPVGVAALGQPSSVTPVQPPQAQVPAPVAASSRFRVVKLDSSSEPFKKGRWICTEYYDKEAPPADSAPSHRAVESSRQPVSESVPCSERESTSGSSVNSAVSTLSHYTESVGSGEMGGPSAVPSFQPPPPQLLDYTSIQASHPSLSQSVSQPQIAPHHPHPQDVVHSLLKASGVPASPALLQQQLTYAQAAQSLPGVAQQQMGYPPAQQPTSAQTAPVPMPASQGSGPPPEFAQHQQISQAGMQARMATAGQQLVPGAQPLPQGLLQQQTTSPPMTQPSQGGGVSQQILSTSGLAQQPTKAQPLPTRLPVEQQPAAGAPVVTSSQVAPNVPPNLPADSAPGLAQSSPPVQGGSGPSLAPVQGTQPPASAQYACLSSVTATQLEDARRLLFQHQALLSLPKMAAGECASETGTSLGPEGSSAVNALAASASLFPLKDGEEDSSSGASVVAIDNKIEQAMDLVKSHLMYAVREEVEVLKEQIKELIERNSQLEQENNLLKTLASPEQLAQFQAQVQSGSPPASAQPPGAATQQPAPPAQPASQSSGPSA